MRHTLVVVNQINCYGEVFESYRNVMRAKAAASFANQLEAEGAKVVLTPWCAPMVIR
jgi:hypothetical protein